MRSPDLLPIENIYSWHAETLGHHLSLTTTIDEVPVSEDIEVTWNNLSVSAIQTKFNSMPAKVKAVLAAKVGLCV